MVVSQFTRTYNSNDNLTIEAFYKDIEIGNISTVGYQVRRQMAPMYVMHSNKTGFVRGKREHTGYIVFSEVAIAELFNMIDIILTGVNEYGGLAKMKIEEVKLMKEGFSPTILKKDIQYSFIAQRVIPWTNINED